MKKTIHIVLTVVVTAVLVVMVMLGIGIKRYANEVPVITVKNVSADKGETIYISDIADFEKAKDKGIILSEYYGDSVLKISEDKQSVTVGDQSGEYEVIVYAAGSNSERREKTVKIKVN